MQGIFQKENTDKALKYGIYRHLPTYEKIIRNLVSFWDKKTNSKNRIGQRVKELRKAHNLTQKTLSAKLQLAGYDFNDLAILRISSRSDGRSCKII